MDDISNLCGCKSIRKYIDPKMLIKDQETGNAPTVDNVFEFYGECEVVIADAKTYYTQYAAAKGFKSPVWKVAVNTERRKEFNCEWCLRPDMQKSGFMADHVATNYPKRNVENLKDVPWTNRDYDYNDLKMDMPIPEDEITKNTLCEQNEAYRGNN